MVHEVISKGQAPSREAAKQSENSVNLFSPWTQGRDIFLI